MEIQEIKLKTSYATKWSVLTEIAVRFVSPVTNMILARLLTPEMFGVVATVTMITSFADIFTDAGFQKYLVQHDFNTKRELDECTNVAFWTNLLISFCIWLGIFIFRNKLAVLVGNSDLGDVIAIASLSLPLTSFSSIQTSRFKRDFDFKSLFYVRIITAFIPFCITIPIAFFYNIYWSLICGTLTTNLLNAIILTVRSEWKPKFFYSINIFKEMFSYSWWILLEALSIWCTSYIGTFIVGVLLSTYYVGIYKTSISTVNQIVAIITSATSMPLFAALSRLKNNEEELIKTYCRYIQAIGLFVIPMGVGIWLYRNLLTTILLGEQWKEATEFIGLWGLMSSITLVLGTYCNVYFNAKGKTYLSFVAQLLHLIVLIPVLIWSGKQGYDCLFKARSMIRFELIFVELVLMKKCVNFPVLKLFKDMFPSVLGTITMFGVSIVLQSINTNIIWQFSSIFICIIVYMMFMYIFYRKLVMNAFGILGIRKSNN